jgi:hypothetical protein
MSRLLYFEGKETGYQLNGRTGGPQIGSGYFGKEKNLLLPPSVIETADHPEGSLLTTLNALFGSVYSMVMFSLPFGN